MSEQLQQQDYTYLVEYERESLITVWRSPETSHLEVDEQYLREGCEALATYCHDEAIPQVLLIDKAARPLWVGIAASSEQQYPGRPKPAFHFINPTYFKAAVRHSESPADLDARLKYLSALYHYQLQGSASPLIANKSQPLLLADVCAHSGQTLYLLKRLLEMTGFDDVRLGLVKNHLGPDIPLQLDVYASDNRHAWRCLFAAEDEELVVDSPYSSYASQRLAHAGQAKRGKMARELLRSLIQENYRRPPPQK
jgi:hypothetical protein